MQKTKEDLDKLTYKFIGAAIEVHRILGPGLLEKVYQKCLSRELNPYMVKSSNSQRSFLR